MAKNNADYCKAYRKREAAKAAHIGIEELKHNCSPGIKKLAKQLVKWHGFGCMDELMDTLIRNAHAQGKEPNAMVTIPPANYVPTKRTLRDLYTKVDEDEG